MGWFGLAVLVQYVVGWVFGVLDCFSLAFEAGGVGVGLFCLELFCWMGLGWVGLFWVGEFWLLVFYCFWVGLFLWFWGWWLVVVVLVCVWLVCYLVCDFSVGGLLVLCDVWVWCI